jgi:Protein kinase domain
MRDLNSVPLLEGRLFHGRYEVVRCLRAGGMGAVYEVVDQKTRRRRALKVMLPGVVADKDLRARFKLEATITAEIESEHLVETLDADVDAETDAPFVVMELLTGEDMGTVLARRGAVPPDEVVGLLHQVALALDRTHAAGVVKVPNGGSGRGLEEAHCVGRALLLPRQPRPDEPLRGHVRCPVREDPVEIGRDLLGALGALAVRRVSRPAFNTSRDPDLTRTCATSTKPGKATSASKKAGLHDVRRLRAMHTSETGTGPAPCAIMPPS